MVYIVLSDIITTYNFSARRFPTPADYLRVLMSPLPCELHFYLYETEVKISSVTPISIPCFLIWRLVLLVLGLVLTWDYVGAKLPIHLPHTVHTWGGIWCYESLRFQGCLLQTNIQCKRTNMVQKAVESPWKRLWYMFCMLMSTGLIEQN